MMHAKNISLTAGARTLLNEVDLQIKPGSFTAIAGPNGAGKSSLLKVLARDITRFSGEVELNGTPSRKYSVAQLARVRAVLPQSSTMQFSFPVREIVEMSVQHERKKVVDEVMELTGIHSWSSLNYLTLSGGEQQRVQLARVLAQVWQMQAFPRYILLDEPTSSLDIAQQQTIFRVVKEACSRNIGVMAIVHDLNQGAQFAEKLYFLKEGKVVAQGHTRDVFTKSNIETTFCCRVNVYHDPCTNCPYFVPDHHSNISSPLKSVSL